MTRLIFVFLSTFRKAVSTCNNSPLPAQKSTDAKLRSMAFMKLNSPLLWRVESAS